MTPIILDSNKRLNRDSLSRKAASVRLRSVISFARAKLARLPSNKRVWVMTSTSQTFFTGTLFTLEGRQLFDIYPRADFLPVLAICLSSVTSQIAAMFFFPGRTWEGKYRGSASFEKRQSLPQSVPRRSLGTRECDGIVIN